MHLREQRRAIGNYARIVKLTVQSGVAESAAVYVSLSQVARKRVGRLETDGTA